VIEILTNLSHPSQEIGRPDGEKSVKASCLTQGRILL